MPYFVMDQLSIVPGLPGLFVACVFSASLSTLSSGFNAMATVTFDDFLDKFHYIKSLNEKTIQRMSKVIAFSYGIATIGMAFLAGRLDSVLQVKNCLFNIYNNFFINFFITKTGSNFNCRSTNWSNVRTIFARNIVSICKFICMNLL